MFGIGFTELILISILAILFLGPDKLPETMVQIAKFMKSVQKTIGEAKSTLEEEMKISDLKEEALNYKKQLDTATSELKSFKNIDYNDILNDDNTKITPAEDKSKSKSDDSKDDESVVNVEQKNETVTFKKKSRKKKTVEKDVQVETENDKKEGEA